MRTLLRAPPAAQRACADCDEEKKAQRSAASSGAAGGDVSATVAAGTASGGAPLPAAARHHFEPRFGADFSDVRVHTGPEAAASARSLNAHAYTFGRDVVFGAGQYDPGGSAGRRLIAHELAHVVQQDGAPAPARRVMRQAAGCDATVDKLVGRAQAKAAELLGQAFKSLRAMDERKLAIVDRQFECLSGKEIDKLLANLISAQSGVISVVAICNDAGDEPCTSGKEATLDGRLLRICSVRLPSEQRLTELFMRGGAMNGSLAFPNSYAALAFDLAGQPAEAQSSKACSPKDAEKRLREARRLIAGIGDPQDCPFENCEGREESIRADIQRALSYVDRTRSILGGGISGRTADMLDYYFSSHSAATAKTVIERLDCTRRALQETLDNDRYGCGIFGPTAKVGANDTPCEDSFQTICLNTAIYFGDSDRERAETFIHEAGHRMGLSSKERNLPDVYTTAWGFLRLGNPQALENTDSYVALIGALLHGAPVTVLKSLGADAGATTQGPLVRLRFGVEVQHPRLGKISPMASLSGGLLGSSDFMGSLLVGVRLADPRPGQKGGIYVDLAGGITFTTLGDDSGFGATAEAKLGYRLGRWDVGLAGGVARGPETDDGRARTLYTGTAGISVLFDK